MIIIKYDHRESEKNLLPLVWLVVDFLTVEVFLVVVLSLD